MPSKLSPHILAIKSRGTRVCVKARHWRQAKPAWAELTTTLIAAQ
jgi:hypothetical protein